MSPEEAAVFGIRLSIITVGITAGAVYMLQHRLSPVYRVSCFMFLAFVTSQVVYVVEMLWPGLPDAQLHAIHMLSYVAAFFLLPTFFIHLKFFSRLPETIGRGELAVHFALPLLVFSLALISLSIPGDVAFALKNGLPTPHAEPWMRHHIQVLLYLEFGGYGFVVVYIWLLFRWQRRNCALAQTVFARSERFQIFWTFGMAMIMTVYVGQVLLTYFVRNGGLGHPVGPIEHSAIALLFILLVAVRGLLQAPGLYQENTNTNTNVPAERDEQKYVKSALAAEHAERLVRKLHNAMAKDLLYRDANLSLSQLSQHIGSSTNYVSQTLNEHMSQSFFHFLNSWRIKEAKMLLAKGNDTILNIAYDVGFNSRSAFYTAFKKHTGITPSQYRAQHASSNQSAVKHTSGHAHLGST